MASVMYSPSGPQACDAMFVALSAPAVPGNPGHGQGAVDVVLDFGSVLEPSAFFLRFTDISAFDDLLGFKLPLLRSHSFGSRGQHTHSLALGLDTRRRSMGILRQRPRRLLTPVNRSVDVAARGESASTAAPHNAHEALSESLNG